MQVLQLRGRQHLGTPLRCEALRSAIFACASAALRRALAIKTPPAFAVGGPAGAARNGTETTIAPRVHTGLNREAKPRSL